MNNTSVPPNLKTAQADAHNKNVCVGTITDAMSLKVIEEVVEFSSSGCSRETLLCINKG